MASPRLLLVPLLSLSLALACSGGASDSEAGRSGAALWKTHCALCHGDDGRGFMGLGPSLEGVREHWSVEELVRYVDDPAAYARGDPRLGARKMPAISDAVTAEERRVLAAYALELMGG